jgi:hypothetical protein
MTASYTPVAQLPQANGKTLTTASAAVTGGSLYVNFLQDQTSGVISDIGGATFVPAAAGGMTRGLKLPDALTDAGQPMPATPTTGVFGVTRTAGSSLVLTGETTSSSTVTDKAAWIVGLNDSYVSGANIAVTVSGVVTGAGTLTAGSTLLTLAAYLVINGVETALSVTAAQQWGKTAGSYVFTVTGTGLIPGSQVMFELTAAVASASGANTGIVTGVSYVA